MNLFDAEEGKKYFMLPDKKGNGTGGIFKFAKIKKDVLLVQFLDHQTVVPISQRMARIIKIQIRELNDEEKKQIENTDF